MRHRGILPDRKAEFVPPSITQPLDFSQLFAHAAPVEIDLGCGDGAFLTALARENPRRNYLGIERQLRRVRSVCRKVANIGLHNVRVLHMETSYAVARLIPPVAVARFHLLFPDPWPKRRHHGRRTVTSEFIAAIHRALAADGLFHIATDHTEYFRGIKRLTASLFEITRVSHPFPQSTFEQRFAADGLTIQRLLLRKTSPVR
jgi:tRNA (guanine-N7-)-methyltransferase